MYNKTKEDNEQLLKQRDGYIKEVFFLGKLSLLAKISQVPNGSMKCEDLISSYKEVFTPVEKVLNHCTQMVEIKMLYDYSNKFIKNDQSFIQFLQAEMENKVATFISGQKDAKLTNYLLNF